MSGCQRRRRATGDREGDQTDPDSTGDPQAAIDYVRRVCETKGPSDQPVLNDDEYVRYLTVGRHKRAPVARRHRSRDRFDEVL